MKKVLLGSLGVILMAGVCLAAENAVIKDDADRISYSIGYQIGGDFQKQGWELKADILVQGIQAAINKTNPLMSPAEMQATLINLKKKLVSDQQKDAKAADMAFLAANAKEKGVVVLPSGVQYKVLKAGSGEKPAPEDNVAIQYKVGRIDGGKIVLGTQSDPKTYALKNTLPGLQEALQLMKKGAIWQIVLPPGPALGSRGEAMDNAGVIVYELELVSVKPGEKVKAKEMKQEGSIIPAPSRGASEKGAIQKNSSIFPVPAKREDGKGGNEITSPILPH